MKATLASVRWAILAAALIGAACSAPAAAPPPADFPALSGRVVDEAELIPPAPEAAIVRWLDTLEGHDGPQMVVVTVPSLGGREIEAFGRGLGNHWRLGDRVRNDGVLLIAAPGERKVRIEVGRGLEPVLTDDFCAEVLAHEVLPRFREGSFAAGIEAGTRAIIERLRAAPRRREAA